MTSNTYYLAQKYSQNPAEGWAFAKSIFTRLSKSGLRVFSPILHTHYLEEEDHPGLDYYQLDLNMLDGLKNPVILVKWAHIGVSKGVRLELRWAHTHNVPIYELDAFMEPNPRIRTDTLIMEGITYTLKKGFITLEGL